LTELEFGRSERHVFDRDQHKSLNTRIAQQREQFDNTADHE
jgi:hypothetical protein